MLGKYVAVKLW